jgi:DNA-directed RNA polymerase subunit omega
MPDRPPTMMEPPVEDLLERVDSKFTLVSLAAMRGRQINSYFNQLGEGLGTIVPPQVTSVSRKPLSISLEEIAAGKITYVRTDVEEGGEDVDDDAGDGSATPDASVGPEAREDTGVATALQVAPETDVLTEPALDTPLPMEPEAEAAPGTELGREADASTEPPALAAPEADLVVIPPTEPEDRFEPADAASELDSAPQVDTDLMEPLEDAGGLRGDADAQDASLAGVEAEDELLGGPDAADVLLGGPEAEDEPMSGPEAEDQP